jgi:hypothetical protein
MLLEARYPPNLPAVDVYSGLVDKMSYRHPSLRDARPRLAGYYERIKAGGELTEYELKWVDWFCGLAIELATTGDIKGIWTNTDGVWGFELDGSKLLDKTLHRNPE